MTVAPTQETAMDDKRVSEMRGRADCAYQIPSGGLWAARDVTDLLDALITAQARIAEMEGVLKWHHDWHLQVGDIGLPDGEGGWIGIDMCDAYSDSLMCEKTTALLAGVPSEVLPRGGVNAHWWQISILQRRKIKELEAGRHADRLALRTARDQIVAFSIKELGPDAAVKNVAYIDAEAAAREIGNEE